MDVRGRGLMWGVELDRDAAEVQKALLAKGFVVGTSRTKVLRLLPPYVVPRPALSGFVKALEEILREATAEGEEPREAEDQEGRARLLGRARHVRHHSRGSRRTTAARSSPSPSTSARPRRRPASRRRRRRPARRSSSSSTRKEEFAKDYLFPVLKAGAVYEHDYLLGTATARPLIAKKQVEVALATGCDALSHGCTGKGNDQVRFELAYMALAPELAIIAPWREWDIRSREDAIDYAAARGIPVPVTKKDPYSRDRNLWHISHEGGPLEEPGFEPEASMFKLTVDPEKAPDTPERVDDLASRRACRSP